MLGVNREKKAAKAKGKRAKRLAKKRNPGGRVAEDRRGKKEF